MNRNPLSSDVLRFFLSGNPGQDHQKMLDGPPIRTVICAAGFALQAILLCGCAASHSEQGGEAALARASHERIDAQDSLTADFELPLLDRRIEVFLPEGGLPGESETINLLVHFHGAAFIPVEAARSSGHRYVVAVVNLGAGSSRYEIPFTPEATFRQLVEAARDSLARRAGRPIEIGTLRITSFSAGYGAVRAILRDDRNIEYVDGLLLLDGLHEDYDVDGALVPGGGRIDTTGMQPFLAFARRAIDGRSAMLITHSAIAPDSYASTTETADYLIRRLGLRRGNVDRMGPVGMQQESEAGSGRLRIMGYPGETAADHLDHIHGLPAFLRALEEL